MLRVLLMISSCRQNVKRSCPNVPIMLDTDILRCQQETRCYSLQSKPGTKFKSVCSCNQIET